MTKVTPEIVSYVMPRRGWGEVKVKHEVLAK